MKGAQSMDFEAFAGLSGNSIQMLHLNMSYTYRNLQTTKTRIIFMSIKITSKHVFKKI